MIKIIKILLNNIIVLLMLFIQIKIFSMNLENNKLENFNDLMLFLKLKLLTRENYFNDEDLIKF